MKRLLVLAALAAAAAAPSQAAQEADFRLETAGNLAALCAAPDDLAAIHMCQGYLVGVNQMHDAVGAALDKRVYCLPDDGSVSRNTAARDFAAWIAATPAAAGMSAHDGLLEWARNTYPCQ